MATMKALGVVILLASAVSAWGQQNNALTAVAAPTATASSSNPHSGDDRPALQQRNPRYQVQRDDILVISFALSPELNQTVTIQPDGFINLQSVGSLYIQGM